MAQHGGCQELAREHQEASGAEGTPSVVFVMDTAPGLKWPEVTSKEQLHYEGLSCRLDVQDLLGQRWQDWLPNVTMRQPAVPMEVTARDLGSLRRGRQLNDGALEAAMRLTLIAMAWHVARCRGAAAPGAAPAPRTHVFASSLTLTAAADKGYTAAAWPGAGCKPGACAAAGPPLVSLRGVFDQDFLLVPVHAGGHYSLAIVCHLRRLAQRLAQQEEGERGGADPAAAAAAAAGAVPDTPCILHLDSAAGYHSAGTVRDTLLPWLAHAWLDHQRAASRRADGGDGRDGAPHQQQEQQQQEQQQQQQQDQEGAPQAGDEPSCPHCSEARDMVARMQGLLPVVQLPGIPQQGDGHSCGLFVVAYAALFVAAMHPPTAAAACAHPGLPPNLVQLLSPAAWFDPHLAPRGLRRWFLAYLLALSLDQCPADAALRPRAALRRARRFMARQQRRMARQDKNSTVARRLRSVGASEEPMPSPHAGELAAPATQQRRQGRTAASTAGVAGAMVAGAPPAATDAAIDAHGGLATAGTQPRADGEAAPAGFQAQQPKRKKRKKREHEEQQQQQPKREEREEEEQQQDAEALGPSSLAPPEGSLEQQGGDGGEQPVEEWTDFVDRMLCAAIKNAASAAYKQAYMQQQQKQ